jgi:hypothetical protein
MPTMNEVIKQAIDKSRTNSYNTGGNGLNINLESIANTSRVQLEQKDLDRFRVALCSAVAAKAVLEARNTYNHLTFFKK